MNREVRVITNGDTLRAYLINEKGISIEVFRYNLEIWKHLPNMIRAHYWLALQSYIEDEKYAEL